MGKLTLQSSSTSGSDNSGIVPNVATNLADELIDCENRKFNLVIQNLPETAEGGGEVDKNHFKSLCSTLDLNLPSFTVTCIGKKIEDNLEFCLYDYLTLRQNIKYCQNLLN